LTETCLMRPDTGFSTRIIISVILDFQIRDIQYVICSVVQ
jgi:hypothetical protein